MKLLPVSVLLAIMMFAGCGRTPHATLSVTNEKGRSLFHISTQSVNGLLGIQIWRADTRDMLWNLNLDYFRGSELAYGEIPRDFITFNGGRHSAKQEYPTEEKKPSDLPANARIFVAIVLQYDTFMAAAGTTRFFQLTTDLEGRVVAVMPVDTMKSDDLPKI